MRGERRSCCVVVRVCEKMLFLICAYTHRELRLASLLLLRVLTSSFPVFHSSTRM